MKKNVLVFIYNSFNDPLFQSTLWLYLKEEAKNNRFQFHLVTYEQEEHRIAPKEVRKIKENLRSQNIHWSPLVWHSGRLKLLKKAYDLVLSFLLVLKIKRHSKLDTIISLGTVAGSFAFILSRIFRLKNFIYQFEPHSEFLADFGIWKRSSISFRLLHKLESLAGKKSEFIATGTRHMIKRLEQEGTHAKVFLLPSCVDDDQFRFDQSARDRIRNELNAQEKNIILYMGKFGGIYFSLEQMADFFNAWYQLDTACFFVILSPQNKNEIEAAMVKFGLPSGSLHVDSVQHSDVPSYLSAADIGVVAVPSYPSQKYRSPIKVGEYLCCGLPYVIGAGISEDDQLAVEKKVGVVIESYDQNGISRILPVIGQLLSENPTSKRTRCRNAGKSKRGFSELSKTGRIIFNQIYQDTSD